MMKRVLLSANSEGVPLLKVVQLGDDMQVLWRWKDGVVTGRTVFVRGGGDEEEWEPALV